jgi:hypothetical protein
MPRVVPSQVVDLIDKLFPNARATTENNNFSVSRGHWEAIAGLLEVIDQIPSELITIHGETYAECVVSIAALRSVQSQWIQRDVSLNQVPGLRKLNPITLIRQALADCPDQFPSTEISELAFIADAALRENLRLDISATNSALINGEWKAATVLAGSVVEALLLWVLQQQPQPNILASPTVVKLKLHSNLEKWDLAHYVEVAAELDVIGADTATQCRLAKDFRNLIHPGRAQRLGQACNCATALSAVAAIEHVVNDLTP